MCLILKGPPRSLAAGGDAEHEQIPPELIDGTIPHRCIILKGLHHLSPQAAMGTRVSALRASNLVIAGDAQ